MAMLPNERLEVVELVHQGHELLERFLSLDSQQSARAWEAVVELQNLVEQLRRLRPPHTFRRQAISQASDS
jgi:hypothetical protein